MSGASKQRTRQERIESLGIPKPRLIQWWERSDKLDVSIRVGIAIVAALAMLLLCQTWRPPFPYRAGSIPERNLVARVSFEHIDEAETDALRAQKLREVPTFYRNRPQPLAQLRAALKNELFRVLRPESFDTMTAEEQQALDSFAVGDRKAKDQDNQAPEARFAALKTVLSTDAELKDVDGALDILYQEDFKYGLLNGPQHTPEQGSQVQIRVFSPGAEDDAQFVLLDSVRIPQLESAVRETMAEQFRFRFDGKADPVVIQTVAGMISDWIIQKLPDYETLLYEKELSEQARNQAALAVKPVLKKYQAGTTVLADAGKHWTPA